MKIERILLMLLLIALTPMALIAGDRDKYPGYSGVQKVYKDWYGVNVSIPESMIRCCYKELASDYFFYVEFGKPDESKSRPTFVVSTLVKLSEFCDVLMEDVVGLGRPVPDMPVSIDDRPWFRQILYNNCGIPYTSWYQYSMKADKLDAKRKKALKNNSYSSLAVFDISRRTNASNCYIIKIPNFNKIDFTYISDAPLAKQLKHRYDTCYSVEFSSPLYRHGVHMLFFVNSKYSRCIDDYVEQMSHYISFDKDFILK